MAMRITHGIMVGQAIGRMNERLRQFDVAQNNLATGKRIHLPSDDVPAMDAALLYRSSLASNAQAQRNAHDGVALIEAADARLGSLVDQLQRARELTVEAGNPVNGQTGLAGIAAELGEILESFELLANSRHQGRPLFAGHSGADPVVQVAGTWTFNGDSGEVRRRVGETDQIVVNVTGNEVFGFDDGEDVFTVLENVAADVTSGAPADIDASLEAIDRAMGHLLEGRATLGAAANRLEKALFRGQADEINLKNQLSVTEDVDVAEAVMELQMQEIAYQAAQGALARSLQSSLASFLR